MFSLEHLRVGDVVSRIVPPNKGRPGYSQSGTISKVTEDKIFVKILVDQYRTMEFSRQDGTEPDFGSFLVERDVLV